MKYALFFALLSTFSLAGYATNSRSPAVEDYLIIDPPGVAKGEKPTPFNFSRSKPKVTNEMISRNNYIAESSREESLPPLSALLLALILPALFVFALRRNRPVKNDHSNVIVLDFSNKRSDKSRSDKSDDKIKKAS